VIEKALTFRRGAAAVCIDRQPAARFSDLASMRFAEKLGARSKPSRWDRPRIRPARGSGLNSRTWRDVEKLVEAAIAGGCEGSRARRPFQKAPIAKGAFYRPRPLKFGLRWQSPQEEVFGHCSRHASVRDRSGGHRACEQLRLGLAASVCPRHPTVPARCRKLDAARLASTIRGGRIRRDEEGGYKQSRGLDRNERRCMRWKTSSKPTEVRPRGRSGTNRRPPGEVDVANPKDKS